jgi:predicted ABC-type ATPase
MKDVVLLGGPNGAGKTTAAAIVLPAMLGIREFVNADEIARGLSPFNPDGPALTAGRLMLMRIRELIRSGENFAFESTCSGRGHIGTLQMCRDAGYRLTLVYLWLSSPEAALARVARRVAEGGIGFPMTLSSGDMRPDCGICAISICQLLTWHTYMTIQMSKVC